MNADVKTEKMTMDIDDKSDTQIPFQAPREQMQ